MFDRKDKILASSLFNECDRLSRKHTKHPGFTKEARFYFSFFGLTLRRDQELRRLIADWAATATTSLKANAEAGGVLVQRAAQWDDFFDGKPVGFGYSMSLVCPGISIADAEGLHRLLETMYDDDFYVAFDIQTPESIGGYPYSREFSC